MMNPQEHFSVKMEDRQNDNLKKTKSKEHNEDIEKKDFEEVSTEHEKHYRDVETTQQHFIEYRRSICKSRKKRHFENRKQ